MRITEEHRDLRDRMLTDDDQRMISCDWVREETLARSRGQRSWEWTGVDELPVIGTEVVVFGGCTGAVCDYSILLNEDSGLWERCVWVKLHSGGLVKANGFETQRMTDILRESLRHRQEELKERLIEAGRKVETMKKERRSRTVVGSHLIDEMIEHARCMGVVIEDMKGPYYKLFAEPKGKKKVYVLKKGGRVDLNGFGLEHQACITITREEAKERHLGRVMGRLDFSAGDANVMDAYKMALEKLKEN